MAKDEDPFSRNHVSFAKLRRVLERMRTVLTFSARVSVGTTDEEESEDDRFAFPVSKVNLEEIVTDVEKERASPEVASPGNTQLIAQSPFSGPFAENLPPFTREEQPSMAITPGDSMESAQVALRHISTSDHSQHPSLHPSNQADSISSEQPLFSKKKMLSIYERLAMLRPHGCIGFTASFPAHTNARSNRQRSVEIPNRFVKSDRLSPSYSIHLLPHGHMPVIQGCDLVRGPLTNDEWMFYQNFAGTWIADEARSDGIQSILDFLGMPSLNARPKKTEHMKISVDEHHIHLMNDTEGLRSIDEQRPWTGGRVPNDRRDQRQGGEECWVERYPKGLIFRTRWTGDHAMDIYEYLELTTDFMHMVTRQDVFGESDRHCQRRVVWDRRLV